MWTNIIAGRTRRPTMCTKFPCTISIIIINPFPVRPNLCALSRTDHPAMIEWAFIIFTCLLRCDFPISPSLTGDWPRAVLDEWVIILISMICQHCGNHKGPVRVVDPSKRTELWRSNPQYVSNKYSHMRNEWRTICAHDGICNRVGQSVRGKLLSECTYHFLMDGQPSGNVATKCTQSFHCIPEYIAGKSPHSEKKLNSVPVQL